MDTKATYKCILIAIMICLLNFQSRSQCAGCTIIVTGQDNNNYILGLGDKLCITPTGRYKGHTLELMGGEVCNMGTCRPKNVILNEGVIDNMHNFSTGILTMVNPNAILNNSGVFSVNSLLSMSGGVINNNNMFSVSNNLEVNGDMFINNGDLIVGTDLIVNTLLENSTSAYIEIGGSMTVNHPGITKNSSCIQITDDFTNHSVVEGALTGCGSFDISGMSSNFGVFGQTGTLDFCDNGLPSGGFDLLAGSIGSGVTNCSCGTGPCYKSLLTFPIELTNFEVKTTKTKTNIIYWRTESETDNDYFTLERSTDALSFTELVRIDGAGTSTNPIDYEWTDKSTISGISYYRLKQTDIDGTFTYSEIKTSNIVPYSEPLIYPNPTRGIINISTGVQDQAEIKILMYNDLGLLVKETIGTGPHTEIDIENLTTGIYILRIMNSGRETRTTKIFKY